MVGGDTRNGQHENLLSIKHKLEQNTLLEFRLGFEEGEFRSKRDVESLIQTIREKFHRQISLHKYSCLKSISIGWRLPNFALGPVLQSVVPELLREPVRVKHLQLVLNDNPPIPEACLRKILSWHSLESLDLRSITLRVPKTVTTKTLPKPQPSPTRRKRKNSPRSKKVGMEEPRNWKVANIVDILPYVSPNVTTLKLMCCGIHKHHIQKLCHHIQHKMHSLKELSLRQNFSLGGGYDDLFCLRGIQTLDLSLCDLDQNDGYCIARAIRKWENENLQQLCLAGNYRLGSSLAEICRAGVTRLSSMDCSFCEVSTKTQGQVFEILAQEPPPNTSKPGYTLRSLRMQGIELNVPAMVNCIRKNSSLRSLVVDHPRETRTLGGGEMRDIVAALEFNYSIEVLKFDVIPRFYADILKDLNFWLRLNKCGRRALLQTNQDVHSWSSIVTQAAKSNDHNILFWLLKHGCVTVNS
mmetsp:Transcript_19659/g.48924  ORF Transcript_19659/g.48924 Transcript_19659/m.48924 type:complete len:468 (-) Transcript_19659:131-1534(-)